jgi:hypothetical protein
MSRQALTGLEGLLKRGLQIAITDCTIIDATTALSGEALEKSRSFRLEDLSLACQD